MRKRRPTSKNGAQVIDWDSKLIRDPLYGFVGITPKEEQLLDTPVLQRLRRIKQLAHTHLVYPSAIHNRLEHSLGSLHVAGRICDELKLTQKDKEIVRLAAMIHDVGHGPFSHVFEEVMRWVNGADYSHDKVTKIIIESDQHVLDVLGDKKEDVLEVFDGESLLSEIVSSGLDSDKMDYLRRDSYHTGVAYGVFDLERVIRTVRKVSEGGRDYIAIHEKGKDALESYRIARYTMHAQVYEHHARLIADDMFLRAVKLALEDGSLEKESLSLAGDQQVFLKRYLELDDESIQRKILFSSKGNAKKLIDDLQNRRLFKRAYLIELSAKVVPNPLKRKNIIEMDRRQIEIKERKIADELGIEPELVIVHLQSIKIKLYERFEEVIGKKEKPILIQKRDGSIVSFDEESPIFATPSPIRRLYVFCPKECKHDVKEVSESVFGIRSSY